MQQSPGDEAPPDPRRWWVLAVLSAALFAILLNNSLLNVAVPQLIRSTGAGMSQAQWIVDAYTLVFAGALLTAGTLGDRYGRKRATLAGTATFGAGSLVALFADGPSQLLAARAVMGLGAAFVMPGTLAILVNVFPARERARAIAVWGSVSALGVAAGPVLGGALVDRFWWGSVFAVSLVPAVLVLVAGAVLLPESADPAPRPADPVGALLGAGAMGGVVYGAIQASGHGWTSPGVLAALAAGGAAAVAFVAWERRHPHPMVDLALLRRPAFVGAGGGNLLLMTGVAGTFFVLTQRLQFGLGLSPLRAGLGMLPSALSVGVGAFLSGRLTRRHGPRGAVGAGLALAAAGIVVVGVVDGGYPPVLAGLVVTGIGFGLAMTPVTDTVISLVPEARSGSGAALNDTLQELGNALGVALVGTVLARRYASGAAGLPDPADRSLHDALELAERTGGRAGDALAAAARQAFDHAAAAGLGTAAAVVAVGAVLGAVLLPGRSEPPAGPAPRSASPVDPARSPTDRQPGPVR
ncbi:MULTISPECIES: MFS transporter [unclassified Kitasatospora]|uniref:MFS transporter n=1 Tax=unclassified Kitasatospora TaxID=2633591 RepID=UPI0033F72D94